MAMMPFLKEDKNIIHYKKIAWRIQEIPRIAPGRPFGQAPMRPWSKSRSLPADRSDRMARRYVESSVPGLPPDRFRIEIKTGGKLVRRSIRSSLLNSRMDNLEKLLTLFCKRL
jgi:hypothetical protein